MFLSLPVNVFEHVKIQTDLRRQAADQRAHFGLDMHHSPHATEQGRLKDQAAEKGALGREWQRGSNPHGLLGSMRVFSDFHKETSEVIPSTILSCIPNYADAKSGFMSPLPRYFK